MWAVGCIMCELLLFQPIFNGNNDMEQIELINTVLAYTLHNQWPYGYNTDNININLPQYNSLRFHELFDDILTPCGIDLLLRLLDYNPITRITAKHALKHHWFTELPLPLDPSQMPNFPAQYNDDEYSNVNNIHKPPTPEAKLHHIQYDATEYVYSSSDEYSDAADDCVHDHEYTSDTDDDEFNNDTANCTDGSIPIPTPMLRSMYRIGMSQSNHNNSTTKRKRDDNNDEGQDHDNNNTTNNTV